MLNVSLDKENTPFDVPEVQSEEEILAELQKDPNFQFYLNQQKKATNINLDLVQEVMAVLTSLEGNYYDSSDGDQYLSLEDGSGGLSYKVLRRLAETEAARLIINKRRLDLAQYARVPRQEGVPRGFKLRFSNTYYRPDKIEKIKLQEWEKVIANNFFFVGMDNNASFSKYLGTAYEDFFALDDICNEIRRNGLDQPIAVHITDPINYVPVIPKRNKNRIRSFTDLKDPVMQSELDSFLKMYPDYTNYDKEIEPDYILIKNHQRLFGVTKHTVRKHHFFTRTDIRKAFRGFSIAEQGAMIATYIINAIKMNSSNFSNNRLPKGFVAFTGGTVGLMQLERLKKLLYAYSSGTNPNRFPMISVGNAEGKGDAKWVGIGNNSREMEYHVWMTLLFSIYCQLSGTDPRELSLGAYSDAVGKKSMFEESSDGIIKESRDTGLKTFLAHIRDSLNSTDKYGKNIFAELSGMDVEIDFVGFEVEDRKLKQDITKAKLETDLSLNELLAEQDKEAYDLQFGGVNIYDVPGINNQAVIQALTVKQQAITQQEAQEQQMQAQGGNGMPPVAGGEEQYTDDDKALMEKYGEPEEMNIEENANA